MFQHAAVFGNPTIVERASDTEVDHARTVGGEDDVRRFEVPVNNSGVVDGDECFGQTEHHRRGRLGGQRPFCLIASDSVGPIDVGGRQPWRVRLCVGIDDRRVEEAADGLCRCDFTGEPLPEDIVFGQFWIHEFDRGELAAGKFSQEHRSHAAAAQPPNQCEGSDPARIVDR